MGPAEQSELGQPPLIRAPKGDGLERVQGWLAWVSSSPATHCPSPNIHNHSILQARKKEGDLDAACPPPSAWPLPLPHLQLPGGGLVVRRREGEDADDPARVPGTRLAEATLGRCPEAGAGRSSLGRGAGPASERGHCGRVGARGKAHGKMTGARAWRWMESRLFAPPQLVLLPRAPDPPTPAPRAAQAGRRGALLGARPEGSGQPLCPPPRQCF